MARMTNGSSTYLLLPSLHPSLEVPRGLARPMRGLVSEVNHDLPAPRTSLLVEHVVRDAVQPFHPHCAPRYRAAAVGDLGELLAVRVGHGDVVFSPEEEHRRAVVADLLKLRLRTSLEKIPGVVWGGRRKGKEGREKERRVSNDHCLGVNKQVG